MASQFSRSLSPLRQTVSLGRYTVSNPTLEVPLQVISRPLRVSSHACPSSLLFDRSDGDTRGRPALLSLPNFSPGESLGIGGLDLLPSHRKTS